MQEQERTKEVWSRSANLIFKFTELDYKDFKIQIWQSISIPRSQRFPRAGTFVSSQQRHTSRRGLRRLSLLLLLPSSVSFCRSLSIKWRQPLSSLGPLGTAFSVGLLLPDIGRLTLFFKRGSRRGPAEQCCLGGGPFPLLCREVGRAHPSPAGQARASAFLALFSWGPE